MGRNLPCRKVSWAEIARFAVGLDSGRHLGDHPAARRDR